MRSPQSSSPHARSPLRALTDFASWLRLGGALPLLAEDPITVERLAALGAVVIDHAVKQEPELSRYSLSPRLSV